MSESIAFYSDLLGFEISGDPAAGWVLLSRDGLELMLTAPNPHMNDAGPTFSGSLYLRTSNVDDLWARLQHHAKVCYPIETFPYGMREFAIYDNNGYLLQFGQEV